MLPDFQNRPAGHVNNMRKLIFYIFLCVTGALYAQKHPVAFATSNEFSQVAFQLKKQGVLQQSFIEIKSQVDSVLDKDIDVPFPKDPAGGYSHERHKANYMLMYQASVLYNLTHDIRYANLIKTILSKYAILNPTLKNHPQATSSSPGRIFWQALNDANWLVYAGLAFDGIYSTMSPTERKRIADGAFKPITDYFTKDIKSWFNLIHNHAVWACSGVGIVGIATDNQELLQMALYGTEKEGKAGFLAQMDGLFSPDGFYHEGPYYARYAVLPFFLFANALSNAKPDLNIFSYRNNILKKALDVALNQTNLNGGFFSYNDALKDKTYHTYELVAAVDIAWQAYGFDAAYLAVAHAQQKVLMSSGGVAISKQIASLKNKPVFPYHAAVYDDGAKGDMGGVSLLRMGKGENLSSIIFKYTSHGLSHGHYDKLNLQYFDKGNEILQDYGAVRYINIEHKWGGRYLPETNSFAQQTIAHNTLTIDETSHYNGDEKTAEKNHPVRVFSNVSSKNVQVASAVDEQAYPGVKMHRTIYMIHIPGTDKFVTADIFKTYSEKTHQYDLPFYYTGVLMKTNFTYQNFGDSLFSMGSKNGYQHLWKEASAKKVSPFLQFTFLNKQTFYTISSLQDDSVDVYLTRIGARDPNFNLRREPAYMQRSFGKDKTFVNVIEPHGDFSPVTEISHDSYSLVTSIKKLRDDADYTAVEIIYNHLPLRIIQCNRDFDKNAQHVFEYNGVKQSFKGPYTVNYNNQIIE